MTGVRGLDVSHWQGEVDWRKVASAGYVFAFCKATEGTRWVDTSHAANVAGASAAGLLVGSYHYAKPSQGDPLGQARHAAHIAGPLGRGRLPVVLDLEETGGLAPAALRAFASVLLAELDKLTHRTAWLYTGQSFYQANALGLLHRPLWLARYGPMPGEPWRIWQHTSSGSVPGIAGPVDLNTFRGTAAELAAYAGATPARRTGPPAWWTKPHRLGDVSQEVASIAKRLNVPLRVTFDRDLDNRVRWVQARHGLPITGVVDAATATAIG